MAFTQGQLITAVDLNSINGGVKYDYPTTSNNHTYYKPSEAGFYYHGSSGLILVYAVGNGWGSSPKMRLQKLINGSWTNVYEKANGGWGSTWGDTVYVQNTNSPGPGWYRTMFVTSKSGSSNWHNYYGQQDCLRGDYLVYWDDPQISGNRLSGESLTADILNSGRCGTMASL